MYWYINYYTYYTNTFVAEYFVHIHYLLNSDVWSGHNDTFFNYLSNNRKITAARIMSTTTKISITGGWLNPQLEKKLNLLFSYRNIWKHKIEFINIKNYYSSTNVCTIYSIFWTWIWKISIASWNKKLAFYCKYLAFFTIFWHWNLNSKNWHFTTNWETSNPPAYQFWTYYPR